MFRAKSHRQLDHISHKRNNQRTRNMESIRKQAETNRDIAFCKNMVKKKNHYLK
jgi:hypothetical protein